MRGTRRVALLLAGLVFTSPASARAPVRLVRVGTFAAPVFVTAPPGDVHRIFVVERGGTIRVVRDGATLATPFLDVRPVSTDGDRGLLSMAFAPDYATSGLFYVYFTDAATGALTIQERRRDPADPDRADPAFARTLLSIPHDRQTDHNGGQLQFGPDGMLYAGTGDGGGRGDPAGNGQNLTSSTPAVVGGANHDPLLGKLLRLDLAGGTPPSNPFPAPAREVWAYGLRNPWRFSFDSATGDLIVADVGQDLFEEVDVARAAGGGGRGANFGWNRFEGVHRYPKGGRADPGAERGFAFPVIEEAHAAGWCAIAGGYVVRDPALPELDGQYVFGDFCRGELDAAVLGATAPRPLGLKVPRLSGFGVDGCGRVYAVSLRGPVYRLASSGACLAGASAPPAAPAPGAATPPAAADTSPPVLRVRAARRQRVLRKGFVALRITCDEACTVRARGTAVLGRRRTAAAAAPKLFTRTVRRTLRPGRTAHLRLRVSRAVRAIIHRALVRPRRAATIRIAVTATDAARNASRRTARVRVAR